MSNKKQEEAHTPPKGILKPPRQKPKQKSFQWDENNIMATYHPVDKTYGHMKIEEPKTPFVFENTDGGVSTYGASFTAEDLAARLAAAVEDNDEQPRAIRELELLDTAEAAHQKAFRDKRKAHYNEFLAAKMAKEKLQHANDTDEDDELDRAAEEAARNARINAEMSRAARAAKNEADSSRPAHHSSHDRSTDRRS
ncbi:Phosphatase inhibitor [Fasciola hepatica]|uniref:Phosphatase inhibitor n=1 Tax=Fasciola hepatica TaxID=6192 RepID=A0A4E0R8D3_FASHE|nr:Phosphatase inhibitor [Fasciola hepatica]